MCTEAENIEKRPVKFQGGPLDGEIIWLPYHRRHYRAYDEESSSVGSGWLKLVEYEIKEYVHPSRFGRYSEWIGVLK